MNSLKVASNKISLSTVDGVFDVGTVIVDTVADLLKIDGVLSDKVYVLGYHTKGDGGGGLFYYDENELHTNHNGGTIISASKTFPTVWPDSIWYSDSDVGAGCWKRVYDGAVNVKWFGAKGDGATDDSKAIQSAIDSSTNFVLLFDKGTFQTSSSIQIASNTKIVGAGRYNTLILNSTADAVSIFNIIGTSATKKENITIQDIGIRNGTASTDIYISGKDGITIEYANNIVIENCYINEIEGAYGLRTKYSSNIKVINNHFYRMTYSGFTVLIECENITVERNVFDTSLALNTPQTYLFATGAETLGEGEFYCRNLWIRNNVFKNNPRWEGIDTHGCENIWIENNYVENVLNGVLCTIADGYVNNPILKNVVIRGNILKTSLEGRGGIVVAGSDNGVLAENIYIEDNEISGFGSTTASTVSSILVYLAKNIAIMNNNMRNISGSGIMLYHSVYGAQIYGNNIHSFIAADSSGLTIGIRLRSYACYDVIIKDNRIYRGSGINISGGIRSDTEFIYVKIDRNFIIADLKYSNSAYLPVSKTSSPTALLGLQGDYATDANDKPTYYCSDTTLQCGGFDWSTITVTGVAGDNFVNITAGDIRFIPIGANITIVGAGSAGDLTTTVIDIDTLNDKLIFESSLITSVTDTTISSGSPTWA